MQFAAARALSLAEYRAVLRNRIDAELEGRLQEWFRNLPPAHLAGLRGILADGKRLRGCVTCLVAEALGGRIEKAVPPALAVEIIQAASLVHDDFVDADALRRGRAAAWTWLTPRRAVLAADLMFATAIERMAAIGAAEAATVAQAIGAMARGAFQEMLGGRTAYQRIIQWKTGSLFAAAARLGALTAAAPPRQVEAAHDFGAHSGAAYQVADDLVEVKQLCNGAGFALQRARGLMPALLYFGAKTGVPPPAAGLSDEPSFHHWFAAAAPRIRREMNEEIVVLVERARAALTPFPDNRCTRVLRDVPAEFARIMAAD